MYPHQQNPASLFPLDHESDDNVPDRQVVEKTKLRHACSPSICTTPLSVAVLNPNDIQFIPYMITVGPSPELQDNAEPLIEGTHGFLVHSELEGRLITHACPCRSLLSAREPACVTVIFPSNFGIPLLVSSVTLRL